MYLEDYQKYSELLSIWKDQSNIAIVKRLRDYKNKKIEIDADEIEFLTIYLFGERGARYGL